MNVSRRYFATHFFPEQPGRKRSALIADVGHPTQEIRKGLRVEQGGHLDGYRVKSVDPHRRQVVLGSRAGDLVVLHRRESDLYRPGSGQRSGSASCRVRFDRTYADLSQSRPDGILFRQPDPLIGEDYYSAFCSGLSTRSCEQQVRRLLGASGVDVEFVDAGEMGYGDGWSLFRVYDTDGSEILPDQPAGSGWLFASPDDQYGFVEDEGEIDVEVSVGDAHLRFKGDAFDLFGMIGFSVLSAWVYNRT